MSDLWEIELPKSNWYISSRYEDGWKPDVDFMDMHAGDGDPGFNSSPLCSSHTEPSPHSLHPISPLSLSFPLPFFISHTHPHAQCWRGPKIKWWELPKWREIMRDSCWVDRNLRWSFLELGSCLEPEFERLDAMENQRWDPLPTFLRFRLNLSFEFFLESNGFSWVGLSLV
jgi:hypothetical protein